METVLAVVVGSLFAAGLYTLLRRSIVRLAIGLVLISHAANLLIFTASGLRRDAPPILPTYDQLPPEDVSERTEGIARVADDVAQAGSNVLTVADPLPQALVLTAIVIGFAVLAYTLVLVHRVYQVVGSDDVESLTLTDGLPETSYLGGTVASHDDSMPAAPGEGQATPAPGTGEPDPGQRR